MRSNKVIDLKKIPAYDYMYIYGCTRGSCGKGIGLGAMPTLNLKFELLGENNF